MTSLKQIFLNSSNKISFHFGDTVFKKLKSATMWNKISKIKSLFGPLSIPISWKQVNQLQPLSCSLGSNYCVSVPETKEKYSPWSLFVSCSSLGVFSKYFLRIAFAFKKKFNINFTLESREQDDHEDEQKESEKENLEEKLTTKEITEALLQGHIAIEVPSQVHIVRIFTSSTFTGILFCVRLTLQLWG